MSAQKEATSEAGPSLLRQAHAELAHEVRTWIHARRGSRLRDVHDEDDVVQEVWLRVARTARRYDPARGSLRAWVHRIVQHALLDHLRGLPIPPLALDDLELTSRESAPDDPEATLACVEQLGALECTDRRLLWLCGVEHLSIAEAARELGLGAVATRKRWWRLRHRLACRAGLAARAR